jgi:hypothetical protein
MSERCRRPSGQCAICRAERRYEIELALVSGVSSRAVAKRFGVSRDAAWRHLTNHISPERRAQLVSGPLKPAELAQRAADEGMSLLDYASVVRTALMARFLAAAECDDRQGAALVGGRLLDCLRLIAQLSGELSRATASVTNNTLILSSPLMADLQSMLIRTLAPFPEARQAVLSGLEELSRRAVGPDAPLPALEAAYA